MNYTIRKQRHHARQLACKIPGILDNLLAAPSHDAACDIWQSFLAQSPNYSPKTHNRAMKILSAHMELRII